MIIECKSYGSIDRQPQGHYNGHILHVKSLRRDGKFACTHVFGSGKRINTIQTAASVELDIKRIIGE